MSLFNRSWMIRLRGALLHAISFWSRKGKVVRSTSGNLHQYQKGGKALEDYVRNIPSQQNAFDLFQHEWSSKLPVPWEHIHAGQTALFEDPRVSWAAEQLGGFNGKRILELGPLEGAHSAMLEKMGALSVLAIEANQRAFLKCLVIKNLLNLGRVQFLLGDFEKYLLDTKENFDTCFASGILYHLQNPVETLARIARCSKEVFIWTHYYDQNLLERNLEFVSRRGPRKEIRFEDFSCSGYVRYYRDVLHRSGFCGGTANYGVWLGKSDLLACLEHFGLRDIRTGLEDLNHPAGPSLCITARK